MSETAKQPAAGSAPRLVRLSWEYSRNQRRHTAYDEIGEERFQIVSLAPYGAVQGKHGYRLRWPGGGHIQFSRRVALLKGVANRMANAESSDAKRSEG